MPVEMLTARCWVLDRPPGDEGEPHYESEDAARAAAAESHPGVTVGVRELTGCLVVACDGEDCEDRPEDDEYGSNIHCADLAEAERFAESCGWAVLTDGRILCPEDAAGVTQPSPFATAAEQIPGQLTLDTEEN